MVANIIFGLLSFGEPAWETDVRQGQIGPFSIGASKASTLAALRGDELWPDPTPPDCQGGWLKAAALSTAQQQCLMRADTWLVANVSIGFCPAHTDRYTQIRFKQDRLTRVHVRCTPPE